MQHLFLLRILSFLLVVGSFSSCVTPVNSRYETAHTLGKGNFEVAGGVAQYMPRVSNEQEQISQYQVIGGRVGYGIKEDFDLKLRYEYLILPGSIEYNINFIELYSKFQFKDQTERKRGAIIQGLNTYFVSEPGKAVSVVHSMAIGAILTFDLPKYVNISSSLQTNIPLPIEYDSSNGKDGSVKDKIDRISLETGWSFDLTLGISSDFDKWELRPFAGVGVGHIRKEIPGGSTLLGDSNDITIVRAASWNYGLGFTYTFQ
ncbi:MAG: hypothetical protein AAF798_05510 [Bacteroidota bacterium]